MAPLRFDKARIEALLAETARQLEGEWLLVGLAGTAAERLALMNLAASAGIPADAGRQDWRAKLEEMLRGRVP